MPNYERHLGIHVKCPYFCSILIKFGISRQIFIKFDNVKFHENLSSTVRADICGKTDRRMYEQTDGRTGAFVDYWEAPKSVRYSFICLWKYIINASV